MTNHNKDIRSIMKPDIAPPKNTAERSTADLKTNETRSVKSKKINLPKGSNKLPGKKLLLGLLLLVLVVAPSAYFYKKSLDAEKKLQNSSEVNKEVIDDFVAKVNKHYLLPTDEQPTLVTVTDVNKVKEQPFFARAENGDKALIYTQARKAVLYRPSKDVVVEVAPLNVDSAPNTSSQDQGQNQ